MGLSVSLSVVGSGLASFIILDKVWDCFLDYLRIGRGKTTNILEIFLQISLDCGKMFNNL